jgi:hypothetical protein
MSSFSNVDLYVRKGAESSAYERRKVIAAHAFEAGQEVFRERPLLSISWTCTFKSEPWQGAFVMNPHTARAQGFLLPDDLGEHHIHNMALYVIRNKPELFRDPAWLDQFVVGSSFSGVSAEDVVATYSALDALLRTDDARNAGLSLAKHATVLHRFAAVVRGNAFDSLQPLSTFRHGSALYGTTTCLNHSCVPNCLWRNGYAQEIVLVARRDIAAGEELTLSYAGAGFNLDVFDQCHPKSLGFTCECILCTARGALTLKSDGRCSVSLLRSAALSDSLRKVLTSATITASANSNSTQPLYAPMRAFIEHTDVGRLVIAEPVGCILLIFHVALRAVMLERIRDSTPVLQLSKFLKRLRALMLLARLNLRLDDAKSQAALSMFLAFTELLLFYFTTPRDFIATLRAPGNALATICGAMVASTFQFEQTLYANAVATIRSGWCCDNHAEATMLLEQELTMFALSKPQ